MSGQIVLDGIRAATRFAPLRLKNSKFALSGYSGGGMATGAASTLQTLRAGGEHRRLRVGWRAHQPHADGRSHRHRQLAPGLRARDGGVVGDSNAGIRGAPNPAATSTGWVCRPAPRWPTRAPTRSSLDRLRQIGTDGRQELRHAQRARDATWWRSTASPACPRSRKAPIFEFHSPTDPLISVRSLDATMKRYCRAGTKVYQLSTPAPEHLSAAAVGDFFPAYQWMADRFAGRPVPTNCRG